MKTLIGFLKALSGMALMSLLVLSGGLFPQDPPGWGELLFLAYIFFIFFPGVILGAFLLDWGDADLNPNDHVLNSNNQQASP